MKTCSFVPCRLLGKVGDYRKSNEFWHYTGCLGQLFRWSMLFRDGGSSALIHSAEWCFHLTRWKSRVQLLYAIVV